MILVADAFANRAGKSRWVGAPMATLTINDKSYDIDKLSDDAKAQLINLQFVDAELARLSAAAAVFQTARTGYFSALTPHLAALDASRAEAAH